MQGSAEWQKAPSARPICWVLQPARSRLPKRTKERAINPERERGLGEGGKEEIPAACGAVTLAGTAADFDHNRACRSTGTPRYAGDWQRLASRSRSHQERQHDREEGSYLPVVFTVGK